MEEPWDFLTDKYKKLEEIRKQIDELQKSLFSVMTEIYCYAFEITGEEELERKGIIRRY